MSLGVALTRVFASAVFGGSVGYGVVEIARHHTTNALVALIVGLVAVYVYCATLAIEAYKR